MFVSISDFTGVLHCSIWMKESLESAEELATAGDRSLNFRGCPPQFQGLLAKITSLGILSKRIQQLGDDWTQTISIIIYPAPIEKSIISIHPANLHPDSPYFNYCIIII